MDFDRLENDLDLDLWILCRDLDLELDITLDLDLEDNLEEDLETRYE